MKIILVANTGWYLRHFRLPLVNALLMQGYEVLLACPADGDARWLSANGFAWREVPFSRYGMLPWSEWNSLWQLIRLYREHKPHVVHHFTIKCVLYGAFAARVAGVRRVIHAVTGLGHAFSGSGYRAWLARLIARMLYKVLLPGSRVIFQNPDDRDFFIAQKFVRTEQCFLIRGSGVDVAHFHPCVLHEEGRPLRVLLASRLLWSKGVGEFVAAAARVRRCMPGVEFLLAGQPDAGNPESIAAGVLENWVREGVVACLGHRDDMADLMRSVDVVVLPSRYGEGVPRCLIEGAACGLPLVASDSPGCREIVREGDNGYLIPVGDAAALAQALRVLLLDPALRARMGQRSRELACREFSQDSVIVRTLEVYA